MTKSDIINYLKRQNSFFKEKYAVEKIGLFGSYARDEAKDTSDIDIVVKMKPKLLDMVAIKQLIEEDLHKKVDIVRLRDKMNPYLKKRILEEVIYAV
ncbi:MAG: nucleotidyltransferase domain-containing protein [Campylobacterales bacterium]